MGDETQLNGPTKTFESSKKTDENGVEYWTARDLMDCLGYENWQNFKEVIKKAQNAAVNSAQNVGDHFIDVSKMVETGSGAIRRIEDWKLSRYACYLIAQNGDSKKQRVAIAQTYFATQTRRQELFDKLPENEKRLLIRKEVTDHNKQLSTTARNAGVSSFGLFHDAGYRGLYGMPLKELEQKKGINKGELLDRAGSTELAANLFRITQTEEKIRNEKIKGERAATSTHFMVGGKVRETIKQIGGELPEKLPTERHIDEVKKDIKALEKLTSAVSNRASLLKKPRISKRKK